MPQAHAVVRIAHDSAQILEFDAEHLEVHKVKAHSHYTRQHGSAVRTDHEFFAEVCKALKGVAEVLVTGGHVIQADFRHYVDKHSPETARHIVGWETINQPSEGELVAFARKYFLKLDKMKGKASLE